jgi:hypothetical protein
MSIIRAENEVVNQIMVPFTDRAKLFSTLQRLFLPLDSVQKY